MGQKSGPAISGLHILILIQFVLLAGLIWLVLGLEKRTHALQIAVSDLSVRAPAESSGTVTYAAADAGGAMQLTPQSLAAIRTLIQDELKALPQYAAAGAGGHAARVDTRPPEQITQIKSQVSQKIQTLRGTGQVSAQQMDEVYGLIGQLPPEDRGPALAVLNRAINAGEINTRY